MMSIHPTHQHIDLALLIILGKWTALMNVDVKDIFEDIL
jgi:hypothetical protein